MTAGAGVSETSREGRLSVRQALVSAPLLYVTVEPSAAHALRAALSMSAAMDLGRLVFSKALTS